MSLGVSYALTGIAIALLVIYGADVSVTEATGTGFLDIDHQIRGIGLGMPSIILPFIALIVARNEKSVRLGGMLIVAGALILVGGLAVLGLADPPEPDSTRNVMSEALPLVVVGGVIIALGIFKIVRSRNT